MESVGVHEILAIKSHQVQWNLCGIHENPSLLIIENLKTYIPQMTGS